MQRVLQWKFFIVTISVCETAYYMMVLASITTGVVAFCTATDGHVFTFPSVQQSGFSAVRSAYNQAWSQILKNADSCKKQYTSMSPNIAIGKICS